MIRSAHPRPAAWLVPLVVLALLLSTFVLAGSAGAVAPDVVSAASSSAPYAGVISVPPARLMDTRAGQPTVDGRVSGTGAVGPGESRVLDVLGRGGVPAASVNTVFVNITATDATQGTYLTVYPAGTPRPLASNLNPAPGRTVANMAVAMLGPDGRIAIYNAAGRVHVVVDVVGFGTAETFYPTTPTRVLDTRPGQPTVDGRAAGEGPLGPHEPRAVPVQGRGSIKYPDAVIVNVTAVDATESTFVTAGPSGPHTSTLNPLPGTVTTNLSMVHLNDHEDWNLDLYNDRGQVDLIVDVVAYVVHPYGDLGLSLTFPERVLDTRTNGGPVTPGAPRLLNVRGRAGIPTTNVGAVVLNLTAVDATNGTFITAYPSGTTRPWASNLNPPVQMAIANLVIVPLGPDGRIALYNAAGSVHLIADAVGWLPAVTSPSWVTGVKATAFRPGAASVTWTPPYPGSSPIQRYEVKAETGPPDRTTYTTVCTTSGATRCVAHGLPANVTAFTLTASTAVGESYGYSPITFGTPAAAGAATETTATASSAATAVVTTSTGLQIVGGSFEDRITFGTTALRAAGGWNCYLAVRNPDGGWRSAMTLAPPGRPEADECTWITDLAIDAEGGVVVAGLMYAPTTLAGTPVDGSFVARLDLNTMTWTWARSLGASGVTTIATDGWNRIVVAGTFSGSVTSGPNPITSAGASDIFVASFTTSGTWTWTRRYGTTGEDRLGGMDASPDGDIAISDRDDRTVNNLSPTGAWGPKATLPDVTPVAVAVDQAGNVFVTGEDRSQPQSGRTTLSKLSPSLTPLWSGTATADAPVSIAVDASGNPTVLAYRDVENGMSFDRETSLLGWSAAGTGAWEARYLHVYPYTVVHDHDGGAVFSAAFWNSPTVEGTTLTPHAPDDGDLMIARHPPHPFS